MPLCSMCQKAFKLRAKALGCSAWSAACSQAGPFQLASWVAAIPWGMEIETLDRIDRKGAFRSPCFRRPVIPPLKTDWRELVLPCCSFAGRFFHWLTQVAHNHGQHLTYHAGAVAGTMSPVSAACAAQLTSEEADLVIIDFAVNDANRGQDGVPLCRKAAKKMATKGPCTFWSSTQAGS